MFEELVESSPTKKKTNKSWTFVLSVTVQSIVLGVMILIPLIYTEALPKTMLTTLLVAPPPPPPPPPPPAAITKVVRPMKKLIEAGKLVAPKVIPKQVTIIEDKELPPEINVGVVGGGTSVNSIPFETWMEVDMRSESPLELEKIETAFLMLVRQAVEEENRARSTREGVISADAKLVGDRPSGQTPADAAIVQVAAASARAAGVTPRFGFSSTDANLPISLGIPAIRMTSGGTGDRAHALDEWIDVDKTSSLRGIRVLLATVIALAELR